MVFRQAKAKSLWSTGAARKADRPPAGAP